MIKNRQLEEYLDLNWHHSVETARDSDNKIYYIVHVDELPGVSTDAYSITEAMELIKDAMLGALKLYLKQGEDIPIPVDEEK